MLISSCTLYLIRKIKCTVTFLIRLLILIIFLKGDNKAGIPKHDVNITRSNKTLQYEIIKLQKYTWYIITVQAFTAKGGGNETTISLRTSEDSKCDMCFFFFRNNAEL